MLIKVLIIAMTVIIIMVRIVLILVIRDNRRIDTRLNYKRIKKKYLT